MDNEIFQEFILDAMELLGTAEDCFLKIEKGESVADHYDVIYRCFDSIKGASGMFDFQNVSIATHKAEDYLQGLKNSSNMHQPQIDYFITFIDIARRCIQGSDNHSAIDLQIPVVGIKYLDESSAELVKHTLSHQGQGPLDAQEKEKFLFDIDLLKEQLKSRYEPVVMIVDDEVGAHKLISKMISTKCLIINALNVNQANTILGICKPHLIISDIKMPGESGLDLLKHMSQSFKDIPVIIISGNPSIETAINALNGGAVHFLEKPFNKNELQNAINKGLLLRMKNYIYEMRKSKLSYPRNSPPTG
ncbi:MAG: response regulator [Bacteriovorax sp.]|nr:response regulator [Bacteriovorax sp.]